MRHGSFASTMSAAIVVLSTLSTPAAWAAPRDSGVGRDIAEQGNRALLEIRAEVQEAALRAIRPELPKADFARLTATTGPGATSVATTAVRCAK